MGRIRDSDTILIVGGSQGIGLAMARLLCVLDCRIIIAARHAATLEQARAELVGMSGCRATIEALVVDVSRHDSVLALRDDLTARVGTPTHVINCAGRAVAAYLEELPLEDYRSMMDLNFMGTVHLSHAFLPLFRARGSGHLIHTSSILGFVGTFGWAAYAATKFAVVGYCESIYSEYRRHGVEVSVLCPPATLTPGFDTENRTKPAAVREAEAWIAPVTADYVARVLLDAIARKRFMVVPTPKGQFLYRATRWLPDLVRRLAVAH
jgi:3-dehydrosphinganine reductase